MPEPKWKDPSSFFLFPNLNLKFLGPLTLGATGEEESAKNLHPPEVQNLLELSSFGNGKGEPRYVEGCETGLDSSFN